MQISDNNIVPAHWLEHLHLRLEEMTADAKKTAFALLYSPWKCSKKDVARYVPAPLNNEIILMQRSVLKHAFRKRTCLSAISASRLDAYASTPDGRAAGPLGNAIHLFETYVGIAKEDLAKSDLKWEDLSGQAQASLLTLYAACETAVHVMAGMFERASTDNLSTHYVIHTQLRSAHKVMWFSRYWAQQSTISDFLMGQYVARALRRVPGPFRRELVFQAWIDLILDKYLCLHGKYVQELSRTKNGCALEELRNRAELICFLCLQPIMQQTSSGELVRAILADQPIAEISYARLEKEGFSRAAIDTLLVESQTQAPGDQLITCGKNLDSLQVHNMLLKYAVQKYLQASLRRIGAPIGEWFEEDYLLRYLEERLDKSRFLAWSGICDKAAGYDADLIIYDKVAKVFYFCQVKHRAEVIQPFLRDELNEFARNRTIRHGVHQLQELRSKIDTLGVRNRLISRAGKRLVGKEPLGTRSRYLLIHTVENFDMCTSGGITMYEWNTFRNLLHGIMHHKRKDRHEELRYGTLNVDFSDIKSVQTQLMSVTDRLYESMDTEQPTPSHLYELLRHAEICLEYWTALWLNDWPILRTGSATLRTPLL